MKMNIVPTSEKHDATRSVVSSELSWLFVNGAMAAKSSFLMLACFITCVPLSKVAHHKGQQRNEKCLRWDYRVSLHRGNFVVPLGSTGMRGQCRV